MQIVQIMQIVHPFLAEVWKMVAGGAAKALEMAGTCRSRAESLSIQNEIN